MFTKCKMFIINVVFLHLDYSYCIFLASFCYFHKQANIYLRGPTMKLLQQENICCTLKNVLKGKENVDIVKIHKSREVVRRNYKYRQHMHIYKTQVREMMQYHGILLNCSFFKTLLFIAIHFIVLSNLLAFFVHNYREDN